MSFRTFNRGNRCPLCNADHSCAVTDDGLHHCHHRHGEGIAGWVFLGVSKIGFGLYRREEEMAQPWYRRAFDYLKQGVASLVRSQAAAPPAAGSPQNGDEPSDPDAKLRHWLAHPARELRPLSGGDAAAALWAKELGLPDPSVFEQLDTQWLGTDDRNRGDVLCFPERDGQGNLIGYSRRYSTAYPGDGRKLAVGRRGILVPRALTPMSCLHKEWGAPVPPCEPIYFVEGASDTLTLLALGRNVLGRPSATGGAAYLIEHVRRLPRSWWDRGETGGPYLIVVGENDGKANGKWPGRSGAYSLAKRLADALDVPVGVVFPPSEFKDVRDWYRGKRRSRPAAVARIWDMHVSDHLDVQRPGQPLRFSDKDGPKAKEVLGAPRPPIDIMPACREIERKRRSGELPDPYAEEEAARAAVAAARADQDRFPCSCPRYFGFFYKSTGTPWIGEFRCEKRCCSGCRQWLDYWELENAILRFRSAENAGKQLYRLELAGDASRDSQAWAALHACILRQDGSFLHFLDAVAARMIVWTTAVPTERSRFGALAVPVSAADAIDELRTRLSRCLGQERPISTSHDWKRLPLNDRSNASVFVGRVAPEAVDKIVAIAASVDAVVVPRVPGRSDSSLQREWGLERFAGWDAKTHDHVFACWFCGEVLPFRPGQSTEAAAASGDPFGRDAMEWAMSSFD